MSCVVLLFGGLDLSSNQVLLFSSGLVNLQFVVLVFWFSMVFLFCGCCFASINHFVCITGKGKQTISLARVKYFGACRHQCHSKT